MCEPITLTALAIGTMAASTAATGYATYASAKNQEAAAQFNQRMARLRSADALQRGNFKEYLQRQKTGQLVGHQRALIGSSGAAVGEGVTARIIEDTLAKGELDALNIRNNASREAWGLDTQAAQFGFEADAAQRQAVIGTGASLLGGTAQTFAFAKSQQK